MLLDLSDSVSPSSSRLWETPCVGTDELRMSLRDSSNNLYVNSPSSGNHIYVNRDQSSGAASHVPFLNSGRDREHEYDNVRPWTEDTDMLWTAPCKSTPMNSPTTSKRPECVTANSHHASSLGKRKVEIGHAEHVSNSNNGSDCRNLRTNSTKSHGGRPSYHHHAACQLVVDLPPIVSSTESSKPVPSSSKLGTIRGLYDTPRPLAPNSQCVAFPPPGVKEALAAACQNVDSTAGDWSTTRLQDACSQLEQCSFYFGKISMADGKKKLSSCRNGTYLLRTSSDPLFLFSLSIKTSRGTTSIRIGYKDGVFRLDSDPGLKAKLPGFPSVVALVEHHQEISRNAAYKSIVFLESNGRKDTPVMLCKSYIEKPASLSHLARLAVNMTYRNGPDKPLKLEARILEPKLISYLEKYPFSV